MKRTSLAFLATLLTFACFAQNAKQLIEDGIKLHDEGKYKGAIEKYDAALALDPEAYLAYYEKALSLMKDGQYEDCISVCKDVLKKFPNRDNNHGIYISYGTSFDMLEKPEKAIEIYEEGIKKFPKVALLHFNKAITLYNTGEFAEAEKAIEQSIINNPNHASSHQIMSLLHEKNNRMYSMLASLYFMGVEPTGKRAEARLKITEELIGANVEKKDDKNVNITLPMPDEKKKEPNNFRGMEMIVSMSVALSYGDKLKDQTKPERMNSILESAISYLGETEKNGTGFGWDFYAPFFLQLKQKGYLETYCHTIYMTKDDETNDKWLTDHRDKVEEYWSWVNSYWKK